MPIFPSCAAYDIIKIFRGLAWEAKQCWAQGAQHQVIVAMSQGIRKQDRKPPHKRKTRLKVKVVKGVRQQSRGKQGIWSAFLTDTSLWRRLVSKAVAGQARFPLLAQRHKGVAQLHKGTKEFRTYVGNRYW